MLTVPEAEGQLARLIAEVNEGGPIVLKDGEKENSVAHPVLNGTPRNWRPSCQRQPRERSLLTRRRFLALRPSNRPPNRYPPRGPGD